MVVSTADRGRDALGIRPRDTEGVSSMHNQFTTPPLFGDPRLPLRFWAKVKIMPSGCWEWQGGVQGRMRYGRLRIAGKSKQAHRYFYQELVGPIPEKRQTDHLCRNPKCVNPMHLEPVSGGENTLRGVGLSAQNAQKTHCLRGHSLDLFNTYHPPAKPRARYCRICQSIRRHTYSRRRREAREQLSRKNRY